MGQMFPVYSIDPGPQVAKKPLSGLLEHDPPGSSIVGVDDSLNQAAAFQSIDDSADVRAALDESEANGLDPNARSRRGRDDPKHVVLTLGEAVLPEQNREVFGQNGSGTHEIEVGLLSRQIEGSRLLDLFRQIRRVLFRGMIHRSPPVFGLGR